MRPTVWFYVARLALIVSVNFHLFSPENATAQSLPLVRVNPETECPGANCLDESHTNGTWGWTFYIISPIVVTDVGWYDRGQDGLATAHRIGLWKDVTGSTSAPYISGPGVQLLETSPGAESIFIPQGMGATLDGPWRKTAIPNGPLTLQPGGYAIGGTDSTNSADPIRYMLDDLGFPGATRHLTTDD